MTAASTTKIVNASDAFGPFAFLVTNKDDSIQRYHAKGEFYEAEDLALIADQIRENGVILDIGANVGNHTVYLARRFPECRIVPFEMVPQTCDILRTNVEINHLRNVDLNHLGHALGKELGWCTFDARHPNNMGLVRTVLCEDGAIPVIPGDSVAGPHRIVFIKIDVEGAEMDVLEGLGQTIARDRPTLYVEVDNKNARRFDLWCGRSGYIVTKTIQRYDTNKNHLIWPAEITFRASVS